MILCVHWGIQGIRFVDPEIHDLAHRLMENGVDVILGHHAHVAEGAKKTGSRFVAFRQGSFFFQPFRFSEKILYGREARKERLSQIIRLKISEHGVDEWLAIPVVPNDLEQVQVQTVNRATYRWKTIWLGKRHSVLFHTCWRIAELQTFAGGGLSRRRLRKWVRNPLRVIRRLVQGLSRPSHR